MIAVHAFTNMLPVSLDATGKRVPRLCATVQNLVRLPSRASLPDGIVADTTRPSERILAYFFHNVLRHYRASPLYKFMRATFRPGDLFLDVGAHLGLYGYLATKLGAEAIVMEPDPIHSAFLERNSHLLRKVFSCAAADSAGTAPFFCGGCDNTGGGSLVASAEAWEASGYSSTTTVQTARIDSVIEPELWPRVALIKIDVEGGEVAALRGIGAALDRYLFDVWCEVRGDNSDRNPGSYREVCRIAAASGYSPYFFDGVRMEPFEPRHVRRVFDLLLTKRNGAAGGNGKQ